MPPHGYLNPRLLALRATRAQVVGLAGALGVLNVALVMLMAALLAGMPAPRALAQGNDPTAEPPTAAPAPPTDVPPPPTAPPAPAPTDVAVPTAEPTAPARDRSSDDDDAGQDVAPAEGTAPIPLAGPTRTRRPTRTPRGGVAAVGTPLPTGSLRVSLAADPPVLVVGRNVQFLVQLTNFGSSAVADLAIEITLPDRVIVRNVGTPLGSVLRSGNVLRWTLAELEPGAETALEIPALVASGGAGRVSLCALMLSWGAPLEQCANFVTAVAGDDTSPVLSPAGMASGESEKVAASGTPEPVTVLLGMATGGLTVALGVWLGLKWRAGQKGTP